MNPVTVSGETHWQFRPKPKLVAARTIENKTRPKVNFLPISTPKPKFGRPLQIARIFVKCSSTFLYFFDDDAEVFTSMRRRLIFYDDDDRDSTSTTSRCFFDDVVHYNPGLCAACCISCKVIIMLLETVNYRRISTNTELVASQSRHRRFPP